jgi:hypothetical protein
MTSSPLINDSGGFASKVRGDPVVTNAAQIPSARSPCPRPA